MAKKSAPQLDERVEVAEKSASTGVARPPIVAVMGHVDHGKTTLLDFLRKTNVATKEAGGITQSIGAYEIEHAGKKITFLDTPGHEAFANMRKRGATLADIAILVVAADDSVKPQTKEVIQVLQETNTPFIVAINKIDKPNVDVNKVKTDLMSENVLLEGFGGDVSWHGISAKTGEGVNELLDLILLTSDVQGFTYNPEAAATGVVLEARMDSRRGIVVAGIVKEGTLRVGDAVSTSSASGTIRILETFLGKRAEALLPSSPVLMLGFESLPSVGEVFSAGDSLHLPASPAAPRAIVTHPKHTRVFDVVLKADVLGSLEALSQMVSKVAYEQVAVRIIRQEVGDITDGDIRFAAPTKALIVGFNVSATKAAENVAKSHELTILTSNIIYELVKKLEDELVAFAKPKPTGELSVLALFSAKGWKQLVGGKVTVGVMRNAPKVVIARGGDTIGTGKITSVRSGKKEVKQVLAGEECGVMIEAEAPIQVGDLVQIYKEL